VSESPILYSVVKNHKTIKGNGWQKARWCAKGIAAQAREAGPPLSRIIAFKASRDR
jgi:hypothetical protein